MKEETQFEVLAEDVWEAHRVGGRLNLGDFAEALNHAFCHNTIEGYYTLEELLNETPGLKAHAHLCRKAQNAWLIYLECRFRIERQP